MYMGIVKGDVYNGIARNSIAYPSAGLQVRFFGRTPRLWDRPIARPLHLQSRTQTQLKCGRTPMSRMEFSMRLIRNEDSECL